MYCIPYVAFSGERTCVLFNSIESSLWWLTTHPNVTLDPKLVTDTLMDVKRSKANTHRHLWVLALTEWMILDENLSVSAGKQPCKLCAALLQPMRLGTPHYGQFIVLVQLIDMLFWSVHVFCMGMQHLIICLLLCLQMLIKKKRWKNCKSNYMLRELNMRKSPHPHNYRGASQWLMIANELKECKEMSAE